MRLSGPIMFPLLVLIASRLITAQETPTERDAARSVVQKLDQLERSLDLVVESGLKPHDYNALVPLVRAAGGHVGNWSGGADLASGAVVAAASRDLYDTAVELLAAE